MLRKIRKIIFWILVWTFIPALMLFMYSLEFRNTVTKHFDIAFPIEITVLIMFLLTMNAAFPLPKEKVKPNHYINRHRSLKP